MTSKIGSDGSVKLFYNATIDFSANRWVPTAGSHAGYIVIRFGGNPMLIPIFNMPGVWGPPPQAMPGAVQ